MERSRKKNNNWSLDILTEKEIEEYIKNTPIMKFSNDSRKLLNLRITTQEVSQVIKKLKKDKVPSPDGLAAMYYKCLEDKLMYPLQKVMNEISKMKILPSMWQEAHITLIYKEGNDSVLPCSYRPISLLKVDYKIFTALMAERLRKCISEIIHPEQIDFVPKSFMKDNVPFVINAVELVKNRDTKACLCFWTLKKLLIIFLVVPFKKTTIPELWFQICELDTRHIWFTNSWI